jgi:hypothetical protein
MAETEIDEYKLDTNQGKKNLTLRVSLINDRVNMVIKNINNPKEKYSNLIRLEQFRNACEAFDETKTIMQALILIKNTIEDGRILLSEDEEAKNIDIKFNIILEKKNYPPFVIGLPSDDPEEEEEINKSEDQKQNNIEVLPIKFDYQGDLEAAAKYGKTTKNTTEYANPIIKSNVKEPNLILEYIEPILQVHYPDGTTKCTPLPPRIQTADGKEPNINPEQLKSIHEQMKRNFSQSISEFEKENNRANSVSERNSNTFSGNNININANSINIFGQTNSNTINYDNNRYNNSYNLNVVRPAIKTKSNLIIFNNSLSSIRGSRTSFNSIDNKERLTDIQSENKAPRDNYTNYRRKLKNNKGTSEYSISSVPNKTFLSKNNNDNLNTLNSSNSNSDQNFNNYDIQEVPMSNQKKNFNLSSNLYQKSLYKSSSSPFFASIEQNNNNQQNKGKEQNITQQNQYLSDIQKRINNVNLGYPFQPQKNKKNKNKLKQIHNSHLQTEYQNSYKSSNINNEDFNSQKIQIPRQNNILIRHNSSQNPLASSAFISNQQKLLNQQLLQEQQIIQLEQNLEKQKRLLAQKRAQILKLKQKRNNQLSPQISMKNLNPLFKNKKQNYYDGGIINKNNLKQDSRLAQSQNIINMQSQSNNEYKPKLSEPIERNINKKIEMQFPLKQSSSQKIIRQKPSFKNEITAQQIALAQMASLQNLQNPSNFNASTVSLTQRFLDREGNEETQSQYEREENEQIQEEFEKEKKKLQKQEKKPKKEKKNAQNTQNTQNAQNAQNRNTKVISKKMQLQKHALNKELVEKDKKINVCRMNI